MTRDVLKNEFGKLPAPLRTAVRREALRWLTAQPLPPADDDYFGERDIDILRERMLDRADDYAGRIVAGDADGRRGAAWLWRYFAYRLTGASPAVAFLHV